VSFAEFDPERPHEALARFLLERTTSGLNGLAKPPRKFTSRESHDPQELEIKLRNY
jgi:hypothetical protein